MVKNGGEGEDGEEEGDDNELVDLLDDLDGEDEDGPTEWSVSNLDVTPIKRRTTGPQWSRSKYRHSPCLIGEGKNRSWCGILYFVIIDASSVIVVICALFGSKTLSAPLPQKTQDRSDRQAAYFSFAPVLIFPSNSRQFLEKKLSAAISI